MTGALIQCSDCGDVVSKDGPTQKYCGDCSAKRSLKRTGGAASKRRIARSELAQRGAELSAGRTASIISPYRTQDGLAWQVRFWVPFTYAASKNRIYSNIGGGHKALRRGARAFRDGITAMTRQSVRKINVVQAKVWIDIFVQKPDHRGDAVNVVDLVCDGVKDGIGIDDRWFAIKRLDWSVVKGQPGRLIIGISQAQTEHHAVCSSCGRILPITAFNKNSSAKLGIGRNCKDCRNVKRAAMSEADEV